MKPPLGKIVQNIAREYFASSTCHGMAYIVHPKLSVVERVCWSLVVLLSLCTCISAIVIGHQKWIEKPMIVSFSAKPIPVWKLPFPAITICPQSRIDVEKFNITEVYLRARANKTLSQDEWRKMRALSHVCSSVMRSKTDYYGSNGTAGGHKEANTSTPNSERVVEQLVRMSQSLDKLFQTCMWSFNFRPCEALWTRKVTENGVCYSFNMLSSEELYTADQAFREREVNPDVRKGGLHSLHASRLRSSGWTMENGYTLKEDLLAYPRRTASGGFKGGAIVLLKMHQQNREYICSGALQGYKVTLHPPDEFPRLSEYHIRIPPMQAVSLIVKPRLLTTQRNLHRFPYSKRQCYFSDERTLRFFRVYNEQNCEFECLTNFTLASCGCVTFAMPRDNTTRVCEAHEKRCYKRAVIRLMELDELSVDAGEELCDCLPACTTIKYDVELSNDWLNLDAMLDAMIGGQNEMKGMEPMLLYVYFKDNKFLYIERVEYMNFNGELANFGGILALLSGMSLTSIAEILYYIVVRPFALWLKVQYRRAVRPVTPPEVQHTGDNSLHFVRPWIP
ncbi:pickpocket protein 28 [Anopheles gambiae]|uniref:pickpocket protein 28 n=1 Tax=Anopheles gambiae TaxID=7165 RepID=UPI002AC94FDD|nr:pickpocket protein 28 [Anopheles gambiae]XP_061513415.1 pickpocket protein 28 [Anopheles gambiae]